MNDPKAIRRFGLAASLFLSLIIPISCSEDPIDENDVEDYIKMRAVSGNNQTERVGARLPRPLVVRVTDILGDPEPGRTVYFETESSGASILPPSAVTDSEGVASCVLTLGTDPGTQTVHAYSGETGLYLTATAVDIECVEEDTAPACSWPEGHIFITTTSSSLITGNGSVLIDFDPSTGQTLKILETAEIIMDLAFSARGELFLTTAAGVFKIDPQTHDMDEFHTYTSGGEVEIAANYGSILCAVFSTGVIGIFCPGSSLSASYAATQVNMESLTADPVTHDLFYVSGASPTYRVNQIAWDGRGGAMSYGGYYFLQAGTASPRGMCADSLGNVYVSLDGDGIYRRIAKINFLENEIDADFFDFYAHAGGNNDEAGRWGDLTVLGGCIYIIDRHNDRLVVISDGGDWVEEHPSDVFSEPLSEGERYGIEAVISSGNCPSSQ